MRIGLLVLALPVFKKIFWKMSKFLSINKRLFQRLYSAARHVAIIGGNANNGANDGLWYWNLNNDSGNANQNIGAHLTCKIKHCITLPLGKTLCGITVEFHKILVAICESFGTNNRQRRYKIWRLA